MVSLVLVNYIFEDTSIMLDNQSRFDFKSDAYKGKPDRILVFQSYNTSGTVGTSGTPPINRRTGKASVWMHNGTGAADYNKSVRWEAWVATKGDWKTPLSEVLTGTL